MGRPEAPSALPCNQQWPRHSATGTQGRCCRMLTGCGSHSRPTSSTPNRTHPPTSGAGRGVGPPQHRDGQTTAVSTPLCPTDASLPITPPPGCVGSPTAPSSSAVRRPSPPPSLPVLEPSAPRVVPNGRRDTRNAAAPTAGTPNPAGGARHHHPRTPQQRPGPRPSRPLSAPQAHPAPLSAPHGPTSPRARPPTSHSPTRPPAAPPRPPALGSAIPPYPRGRRCCRCCPPIRAPPPPSCRLPRPPSPRARPRPLGTTHGGGGEAPPRGRDHSGCAGGRGGGIAQGACAGCVPRDERRGSLSGRARRESRDAPRATNRNHRSLPHLRPARGRYVASSSRGRTTSRAPMAAAAPR